MDVAFAVRSNLTFNGFHDDDSPIHGKAVTFRARDCLHVKAVSDNNIFTKRCAHQVCIATRNNSIIKTCTYLLFIIFFDQFFTLEI